MTDEQPTYSFTDPEISNVFSCCANSLSFCHWVTNVTCWLQKYHVWHLSHDFRFIILIFGWWSGFQKDPCCIIPERTDSCDNDSFLHFTVGLCVHNIQIMLSVDLTNKLGRSEKRKTSKRSVKWSFPFLSVKYYRSTAIICTVVG